MVTQRPFAPTDSPTLVSPTTAFHIRFDRLLDPTTANRQAVCVRPFVGNVPDPSGCTAGVFTEPSYDPVLREIAFYQSSGQLAQGTLHEVTLYTPGAGSTSGASGILSYDGVALAQPLQFEFTTDKTGVIPPLEPGPTGDHYCGVPDTKCDPNSPTCVRSVSQILTGCALQGCHGAGDPSSAPAQASLDLRLDGTANLLATALDHTAHETETGEKAAQVQGDSLRFGRSMAILSTQGPGYSYLVYKLLANPSTPLMVPWNDGNAEITRLQSSLVVGMPMPPTPPPAPSSTPPARSTAPASPSGSAPGSSSSRPTPPCQPSAPEAPPKKKAKGKNQKAKVRSRAGSGADFCPLPFAFCPLPFGRLKPPGCAPRAWPRRGGRPRSGRARWRPWGGWRRARPRRSCR